MRPVILFDGRIMGYNVYESFSKFSDYTINFLIFQIHNIESGFNLDIGRHKREFCKKYGLVVSC
jgi:hypothetical protein